jgi:hypothetical protein
LPTDNISAAAEKKELKAFCVLLDARTRSSSFLTATGLMLHHAADKTGSSFTRAGAHHAVGTCGDIVTADSQTFARKHKPHQKLCIFLYVYSFDLRFSSKSFNLIF